MQDLYTDVFRLSGWSLWYRKVKCMRSGGCCVCLAGNHAIRFSGEGGLSVRAELNVPNDATIDADGNVYLQGTNISRIG